jgi:hypothetical protein
MVAASRIGLVGAALAAFYVFAVQHAKAAAPPGSPLDGVWLIERPTPLLKGRDGKAPPLKPDALTTYRRNLAARDNKDYSFDATRRRCTSPGAPRIMTLNRPFELITRPGQVMLVFSWNRLFRQIHTGSEPPEVLYPTAMGKSAGQWKGGVLVVETTGRDDKTLLDDALPSSEELKITERFSLRGTLLEDRITITDPTVFTRPWETILTYRRLDRIPDDEDVCLDRLAAGRPAIEDQ